MQIPFCCIAKCQLQVDLFVVSGLDCDVYLSFPDNLLVKKQYQSFFQPNWSGRMQGHFCCIEKCQLQVD